MPKRPAVKTQKQLIAENLELHARLAEAEGILRTSHSGEANVPPVTNQGGERVFTLNQAVAAQAESEEKFRKLVEHLPSIVYMNAMDDLSSPIYISPQIKPFLGYTVQEWLADPKLWSKTLHPDDRQVVMVENANAKQANRGFDMEYRMIARDGRVIWVQDQAVLVDDLEGQPKFRQGILLDITARKQSAEALQESESSLRRLIEYLPTVVYTNAVGDPSSTLYVSPQINTLLGYTPQEWLANPKFWLSVLDPKDHARVLGEIKTAHQTHKSFELEYRMIARDGRIVWVHDHVTAVNDSEGQQKLWQGVMRDITERKQAEEELYESEERFRNAFQYSAIGMALVSLNGQWLKVNPMLSSIIGYSEEELLTKTFQEVTHPDDLNRDINYINQLLAGEIKSYKMEKRYFHKNGTIVWVLLAVALARDSTGTPLYFISQMDETTEFKLAEQTLRTSDERFRQVWETTSDAMALSDPQGIVLAANPSYLDLYGYKSEQIIGSSFAMIFPQESRALAVQQYKDVFANKIISPTFESVVSRADHTTRTVETHISFLSTDGKRNAMLSTIRDITEKKRSDMEIQQRLSELEVLYQSGLALGQIVDPKAIAQKMIDLLDQKMDWHHTVIRLYDPQTEVLELLVFNQPNALTKEEQAAFEERLRKSIKYSGGGFSGWVIQHGKTVRSNDVQKDPRYVETFPGLQSGLYVPVKIAERVIGVISIESEVLQAFSESDERLVITLATQAAIAMENAKLFQNLKRSNIDLGLAYDATIEGWSRALDLRDKETEGHSQRVTQITVNLARSFGISEADLVQVRWGALLHDIGKMGVPDSILHKPGSLTDEEWTAMKKHPRFAYDLLSPIRYLRMALDIPYCHHEKWDGSGYPRGLKGEQIPLSARIFAVVDVWDALCSDRPYRAGWAKEKVREHIAVLSGTHFDPQVVAGFMHVIE